MSNIALIFYGQLRHIKLCYLVWKQNVIDPLNIKDIYSHTWIEQENISEYTELYKPKRMLLTSYDDVKESAQWIENPERKRYCVNKPFNVQCLLFSMYKAVSIVEKRYDYFILSRIDHIFYKPLDINRILTTDDEIISSTAMYNPLIDGRWFSACDWFAIGKSESVRKFSYVGRDYRRLYDCGIQYHSETFMGENAKEKGLKIKPLFIVDAEHCLAANLPGVADDKTYKAPVPEEVQKIYRNAL
jgi:hypothetical protein